MRSRIGTFRCPLAWISTALLVLANGACSSDSDSSSGAGGSVATGGVPGSGGGGVPGTGGYATGGATPTGGSYVTGGAPASGGAVTGGAPSTGGAQLTGGAPDTGGTTTSGATGGGGMSETGGALGTGGTGGSATGGTGGDSETGGTDGGRAGSSAGGMAGATTGGNDAGGTGGAEVGFMPCPTTPGTACNVMPVGDSITEGCCTPPMGGYRIELFHQTITNQKNITFVGTLTNGPDMVDNTQFPKQHEGHGGWKISQIAGVIDNAIAASSPHIVLLKIGTNDINGNDDIANAPSRLASLIDQITNDAPEALLVVSAIIPTTNDGTNQRVAAYNAAIQVEAEAAAAAGKHVVFVDNYAVFAEQPDYKTALMADGLHPNAAGYQVLGRSFYDVIEALLPSFQ